MLTPKRDAWYWKPRALLSESPSYSGLARTCRINPAALRSAEDWIADRRTMIERRLDRLGEYLAQTAGTPDQAWATEPGETTNDDEEQQ